MNVSEVQESVKRWVETDYIPQAKSWTEEYNAKVDDPNQKYYHKKREFKEEWARREGKERFITEYIAEGEGEVILDIGKAEHVITERVDSNIYTIFKIDDQYFKVSTGYDSWSDTDWEYAYWTETRPVEKTITTWV